MRERVSRREEAMFCKVEACAECAHNCRLIHGNKRDPSSFLTSFFKVMIGDNYSQVLFLPPKFAHSIPATVGMKTQLEDSSGEQWTVTLSKVDGSLAFEEGWPEFSFHHGLKEGDFLVFNCIMGSHFIVHIYGTSACVEHRQFEEHGNRKKRTRTNGIMANDGLFQMNDKGHDSNAFRVSVSDTDISQRQSMAKSNPLDFDNHSGTRHMVSETRYCEEPFCMFDRDPGYIQGEDRCSLFDLSNFEIQRNCSDADRSSEISVGGEQSPHHDNTRVKSPTGALMVDKNPVNLSDGRNEISVGGEKSPHHINTMVKSPTEAGTMDKDPVNLSGHVLESWGVKPAETEKKSVEIPMEKLIGHVLETCVVKPAENEKKSMAMQKKKSICQNAEERSTTNPRNQAKVIKEGDHTFSLAGNYNDAIFKAVKTEPVDTFDIPPPDDANISWW